MTRNIEIVPKEVNTEVNTNNQDTEHQDTDNEKSTKSSKKSKRNHIPRKILKWHGKNVIAKLYNEIVFGTNHQNKKIIKGEMDMLDIRKAIYSVALDKFKVSEKCPLPLVSCLHEFYFHRYTTYVLFCRDKFLRRQNHVDNHLYGPKVREEAREGIYPVTIMVVQRFNKFSPSVHRDGKSVVKSYALVHLIATKGGMERNGYATKLLDHFIRNEMSKDYLFVANKPNPDIMHIDNTNWERYANDTTPHLTENERKYFHTDSLFKNELSYSTEQVKFIQDNHDVTVEEQDAPQPQSNNTKTPATHYMYGEEYQSQQKCMTALMKKYEMTHCSAVDISYTCDDDNIHGFNYKSHMHQRTKKFLQSKLPPKGKGTEGTRTGNQRDIFIAKVECSSPDNIKWIFTTPFSTNSGHELHQESPSEDIMQYLNRGYFQFHTKFWGYFWHDMTLDTVEKLKAQVVTAIKNPGVAVNVDGVYGYAEASDMIDPKYHCQPLIHIPKKFLQTTYHEEGHCTWLCMAFLVNKINPDVAYDMLQDMITNIDGHRWLKYKRNNAKEKASAIDVFNKKYGNCEGIEIKKIKVQRNFLNIEWLKGQSGKYYVAFLQSKHKSSSHAVAIVKTKKMYIFDCSENWAMKFNEKTLVHCDNDDFVGIKGLYLVEEKKGMKFDKEKQKVIMRDQMRSNKRNRF